MRSRSVQQMEARTHCCLRLPTPSLGQSPLAEVGPHADRTSCAARRVDEVEITTYSNAQGKTEIDGFALHYLRNERR